MADALKDIIERLEQQKMAIERALSALRDIEGTGGDHSTRTSVVRPAGTKRKGGMTPEGRQRLVAALKRRWAAKKAAGRKGRITPEGRKRLAEAMKRRWAVKRTAAQAKARGSRAA